MSNHKFQVNLRGVIELLSQHLYSSPDVFVRELLQNAVDAIQARRLKYGENFKPEIEFDFAFENGTPVVRCRDNGVGLTEEEAHEFLSVIGLSSKSEELAHQRASFIGQFGIGLLSGFMVSDEIRVVTRSAQMDSKIIEWRGLQDGTYTVRQLDLPYFATGTEVTLYANAGSEYYFAPEHLYYLLKKYGEFLPETISLKADISGAPGDYYNFAEPPAEKVNADFVPWCAGRLSSAEQRAEWMNYARQNLYFDPLDCFPFETDAGKLKGVAFIRPAIYDPNSRQSHRVYLKGMLLSENFDYLLPASGFFVTCVVNSDALAPTASRESFQESEAYSAAREELADCLKNYCRGLVSGSSKKLQKFLEAHQSGIKQLAVYDDRLYAAFVEHLPFETTRGAISLSEFRRRTDDPNTIHYAATIDDFRQLEQTAQAQSVPLVNAGYGLDCQLIEKLPDYFPEIRLVKLTAARLEEKFDFLELSERDKTFDLLAVANRALRRFGCEVEVRKFYPAEIPAMYVLGDDGYWFRSANANNVSLTSVWTDIDEALHYDAPMGSLFARLCLNFRNPLIVRLCSVEDAKIARVIVEILYIQSLLAGHYSLSAAEQNLLNKALRNMVESSMSEFWGESFQ